MTKRTVDQHENQELDNVLSARKVGIIHEDMKSEISRCQIPARLQKQRNQ